MIRLIDKHEIDVFKWDNCVESDRISLPYALHWYLDLCTNDWEALVYNDYQNVMPLPFNKKYGISYIYRPYGTQQLGIFGKEKSPELTKYFLQHIPKKYRWVDYFFNEDTIEVDYPNCKWEPQINQILDLRNSYQSIYENYSTQTIKNLNKAKKANFRIFENDSPDVLIRMFQNNKGKEIPSLDESKYSKMRQIMYAFLHKRKGFIWTVYDDRNTACSGIFIMQFKNRLILMFTAADDYGKQHGGMSFLLNELFIQFSEKHWIFDFEGSNLEGLARFNSGFGAEKRIYYRMVRDTLPWIVSSILNR